MVSAKMWESIRRLFQYFPPGMLTIALSSKISAQKSPKFRRYSLIYLFYFGSYALPLPLHIVYRLLVIELTLPLTEIHYVM